MKDKEKIFKLLLESAETPQESFAVEEMIRKIEGIMPPIETVSDTQKKIGCFKFYRNKRGNFCCTTSIYRFIWIYFNGDIPEGYDVHHRDFNHDNNDISNLELLTKDEHKKIHGWTEKKLSSKNKICACCGIKFEASNGNRIYCSSKCRRRARRIRQSETKVCIVCGKEFLVDKHDDAKCCSNKCSRELLKKREEKICPVCGKNFSAAVSRNRKYCSHACATEAMKTREIRICVHCGKEFFARSTRNQKFCSRECYLKSKRKK